MSTNTHMMSTISTSTLRTIRPVNRTRIVIAMNVSNTPTRTIQTFTIGIHTESQTQKSGQARTWQRVYPIVLHRITGAELKIRMVDEPHGNLRFLRRRMMVVIYKITDEISDCRSG